jgi:hypothetical protein
MLAELTPDPSLRAAVRLHEAAQWLPFAWDGPLLRKPDGRLLGLSVDRVYESGDGGDTWEARPLYQPGPREKAYKISAERAICLCPDGTVVAAFVNLNEMRWLWRDELRDALPGTRLPQYVVRSPDGGRAWEPPTWLHDEWTGEVRDLIRLRSGRLVLSSMKLAHNPGRHTVLSYVSDDAGKSWKPSPLIDLGGMGHHGGVTEATIEQLRDGRVLMFLRTNWGRFWQAFSEDEGLSWRRIEPSPVEASSAPGLLKRLASGRLVLLWNRPLPEGKDSYPLRGGDGLWSEVPVSNHRGELSMAFSEDEGRSFTKPVVIARRADRALSYPRLLEFRPGELWVTTMQGGLAARLLEKDFA